MFLPSLIFLSSLVFTAARNEDHGLEEVKNLLRQQHELILKLQVETANQRLHIEQQDKRIAQLEAEVNPSPSRILPYNTTVEELEVRVERLEEDMFQAQVDIGEAEIDIDSLEFSLQETAETVMDHTDNLIQLNDDLTNVQRNIEEIEDRTTAAETNIILLESEIEVLDTRTSDIEQMLFETKNSAFYATLNANVVFETNFQTIVFGNDTINEGGHYNTTTGIYTAPVTGIYQFFAYIRSTSKANFYLLVDGSSYINPSEDYGEESIEGEGASVIVRLQAGQTVYVTTGNQPYTVHGNTAGSLSWFGGYLLFPEAE